MAVIEDSGELPLVTSATLAVMLETLVDRGYTKQEVRTAFDKSMFDEASWWSEVGGPLVDRLAEAIGLEPVPPQTDEDAELLNVVDENAPSCVRCGHRGGLHHSRQGCLVEVWEDVCTCPLYWDGVMWSIASLQNVLQHDRWEHLEGYDEVIHDVEPVKNGNRVFCAVCKHPVKPAPRIEDADWVHEDDPGDESSHRVVPKNDLGRMMCQLCMTPIKPRING